LPKGVFSEMHFVASLLIFREIRVLRDVFLGKLGHLMLRHF